MQEKGSWVNNPCRSCGACCAYYRVSFYWGEIDEAPGGYVPTEMTKPEPPFHHVMRGTDRNPPRCVALEGEVGHSVRCAIYERRPSPCRDFGVHWEHGRIWMDEEALRRCNQARMAWGLPPLAISTTMIHGRMQSDAPRKHHRSRPHSMKKTVYHGSRNAHSG